MSLKEWKEGHTARRRGLRQKDCPYNSGRNKKNTFDSDKRSDWLQGWSVADVEISVGITKELS